MDNIEKIEKVEKEKSKHKHKKKSDKDKREERKKEKKSDKKTEKTEKFKEETIVKESPKEEKISTPKPETENNVLREKASTRNLNILQSQSQFDSSSNDDSSLEIPIKVEKTDKKEKTKKEEKKRKRTHEVIKEEKIEEPPVKVTRDEDNIASNEDKKENVEEITQDYMSILRELQHKIMTLQDNAELQRVVSLIAETGHYEITAQTFDFDLCALDRDTVRRLQEFFAIT